jgi:hypothetical protein
MSEIEEKATAPEVLSDNEESEAPGHCVGCHKEAAAL